MAIAREFPWRFTRHPPTASQVNALAKIGLLALLGRHGDAAGVLLRSAYSYRDDGSAWDAFPVSTRFGNRLCSSRIGASALVLRTLFGVGIERCKSANWKVVVGVVISSRRLARPLVLREWRAWR